MSLLLHPFAAPMRARLASLLRGVGALSLLLLCSGCTTLYFHTLNSGTAPLAPIRVQPIAGQSLGMDIYPTRAEQAPVLIFLYGGRWQSGSRAEYAFVGERLAAEGVLTLIPDYRLYPAVRFPTFVEDIAAVVAWARQHVAEYGGDPQRIYLAGHSAGAHIAALIGTDARYLQAHGLQPRDLAGVIGIAGPYDFLPLEDDDLIDIFGTDPAQQARSQPVNFVDGDEPPFLLLHGDADLLVWLKNSEHLKARFDAIGEPATLQPYPGIGHIRILAALRFPSLGDTRADLLQFMLTPSATSSAHSGLGAAHP